MEKVIIRANADVLVLAVRAAKAAITSDDKTYSSIAAYADGTSFLVDRLKSGTIRVRQEDKG